MRIRRARGVVARRQISRSEWATREGCEIAVTFLAALSCGMVWVIHYLLFYCIATGEHWRTMAWVKAKGRWSMWPSEEYELLWCMHIGDGMITVHTSCLSIPQQANRSCGYGFLLSAEV